MADKIISRKGTVRATLYLEREYLAVLGADLDSKSINALLAGFARLVEQGAVQAERHLSREDWQYLALSAQRAPQAMAQIGHQPDIDLWALAEEGYNEGHLETQVWSHRADDSVRMLLRSLTGLSPLEAAAVLTALRHWLACAGCRALVSEWWTTSNRIACAYRKEQAEARRERRKPKKD